MATDNAVMRYKDIKYYNEKLQGSMPSGGGVSSLADLGITLSADEINNLPTDKYAYTDVWVEIPPSATPSTIIRERHYLTFDVSSNVYAMGEIFQTNHWGNIRAIECDSTYVRVFIDYTQPSTMNDLVWVRLFHKKVE